MVLYSDSHFEPPSSLAAGFSSGVAGALAGKTRNSCETEQSEELFSHHWSESSKIHAYPSKHNVNDKSLRACNCVEGFDRVGAQTQVKRNDRSLLHVGHI